MIYLVRHGEAAAGWGDAEDPGLSLRGREQAARAARTLANAGVTQILTSPMQRCRETAAALEAETGHRAMIEPAVSEIPTPQGLTDRPAWLRDLMGGDWPEDDLLAPWRAGTLAAIRALAPGTAVFSHFVAINAIVGQILGERKVLVFRPDNASITRIATDEGALRVMALGDAGETRIL